MPDAENLETRLPGARFPRIQKKDHESTILVVQYSSVGLTDALAKVPNWFLPYRIKKWQNQQNSPNNLRVFISGEGHKSLVFAKFRLKVVFSLGSY